VLLSKGLFDEQMNKIISHHTYQESGEEYVQQRKHEDLKLQAIRRLQRLGYEVSLEESTVA
jgi:hypothetical protein